MNSDKTIITYESSNKISNALFTFATMAGFIVACNFNGSESHIAQVITGLLLGVNLWHLVEVWRSRIIFEENQITVRQPWGRTVTFTWSEITEVLQKNYVPTWKVESLGLVRLSVNGNGSLKIHQTLVKRNLPMLVEQLQRTPASDKNIYVVLGYLGYSLDSGTEAALLSKIDEIKGSENQNGGGESIADTLGEIWSQKGDWPKEKAQRLPEDLREIAKETFDLLKENQT